MVEFDPSEFEKPLSAETAAQQPPKPPSWIKKTIDKVVCVFTGKKQ